MQQQRLRRLHRGAKRGLFRSERLVRELFVVPREALAYFFRIRKRVKPEGPFRALQLPVRLQVRPLHHPRVFLEPLAAVFVHVVRTSRPVPHQAVARTPRPVLAAPTPIRVFNLHGFLYELGGAQRPWSFCQALANLWLPRERVRGGVEASLRTRYFARRVAANNPLRDLGVLLEKVGVGVRRRIARAPEPRRARALALAAFVRAPLPRQNLLLWVPHGHHALANFIRLRKRVLPVERIGTAFAHAVRLLRKVLRHPLRDKRVAGKIPRVVLLLTPGASEAHLGVARAVAAVVRAPLPRHIRCISGDQAVAARAGVI
mmetsp:Transcript_10786/g.39996  ORF Transcript_10786/g.39996 Transcript_10786/m.39996 type:complete len:317 (+) Transcript_10786:514-1464(+)